MGHTRVFFASSKRTGPDLILRLGPPFWPHHGVDDFLRAAGSPVLCPLLGSPPSPSEFWATKHIKCSASLIIRKMQIKTTARCWSLHQMKKLLGVTVPRASEEWGAGMLTWCWPKVNCYSLSGFWNCPYLASAYSSPTVSLLGVYRRHKAPIMCPRSSL